MEFLSSPLLRHRYVTWFEVGFCNLSLTFCRVWSSGKKAFRNARKSHPINQSHVCTLLGFLGTNGSTRKHELTRRSDLPFRFRGFIWPAVHHRRQCQSDIFCGWDHWLSLTFWLQGWVFLPFLVFRRASGNSTWPAQFLKASKLWNLNVPQCWHIEIHAPCWKFMDTDTYLDYQVERLSFFLGIKTRVYIYIYIDLNRITMYNGIYKYTILVWYPLL